MARKPRWQERKQKEWYDKSLKFVTDEVLAEHEADRDPSVWSLGLLADYGAELWAHCHTCGVEKNVDLASVDTRRPIRALKLRCSCGGTNANSVVKWWSMAGTLCTYNLTTGEHKGAWKLLLKPPEVSRRAEPDPALPPLEWPKGYRAYEPALLADGSEGAKT